MSLPLHIRRVCFHSKRTDTSFPSGSSGVASRQSVPHALRTDRQAGETAFPMPRIALLTRYDTQGASSRVRTLQYLPVLHQAGIETEHFPLFDNDYLKRMLRPGKCRGRLKILRHKGFICFSDFRRKSGMWKIAGSRRGQLFPYIFMSNTVMPASLRACS